MSAVIESLTSTLPADLRDLSLREMLADRRNFITAIELVTTRGIISDKGGKHSLGLARDLAAHPRVNVLSITDNPGGNAMLAADTLGTDLIARGQEVIIHLSCKDWNRNALQSRAWKLASEGFRNVLALSGDYPVGGWEGQASPVFDIDSVGLLAMFNRMNYEISSGEKFFNLGAVVTNHKRLESEVMPQYFKLAKKLRNGAQFIINQIGYDARKQDELLRYMRRQQMDVPVLYNVFVLSAGAARFFHSGKIPGCVVTDELMAIIEKHAGGPDKGKSFFIELAAKQCAIGRGLGYRGVYLGGHLKMADYEKIFALVDSFAPDDWRQFAREICFSQPGEFFYFEPDPATGLNTDGVNPTYVRSLTPEGRAALRRSVPLAYRINRAVHSLIFEEYSTGFKIAARLYKKISAHPRLNRFLHRIEHAGKGAFFECRDCGDCSLPDIAYLCPESQCAKNQRNGPCGGTRPGGCCEVTDKKCIWALAYERLKPYGEEEVSYLGPVIYKNAALRNTSAWANTFLGRDHHARLRAVANPDPAPQSTEKKSS